MKNRIMKKLGLFILSGVLFAATTNAQVKTPMPSPTAEIEQKIGLSEIEIEYSRPGVKGRTIFGDLVPFGEMWRTGANGPCVIDFDDETMVEGNKIAKGKYAMFTIPGEDMWTIVLNSNTKKNAWEYDESTEAARFEVKPVKIPSKKETFTIEFDEITDASATLNLVWENTRVPIKLTLNTDEAVMASIKDALAGPSAGSYYQAARYYYQNKKDLKMSLDWITKACNMDPDKYWMLKWKAEIQFANGLKKEAIATATKSKELAAKAENKDYVKLNEDNIAKWSKK